MPSRPREPGPAAAGTRSFPPGAFGPSPPFLTVADESARETHAVCRVRAGSGRPEGAEIDGRVARLPAGEEALDRRVEHDRLELVEAEKPVAADGRVLRGHRLERAAAEIAREDDVHHVLRREASLGCDRVDDRDGALQRELEPDSDLLRKLTVQRVH